MYRIHDGIRQTSDTWTVYPNCTCMRLPVEPLICLALCLNE